MLKREPVQNFKTQKPNPPSRLVSSSSSQIEVNPAVRRTRAGGASETLAEPAPPCSAQGSQASQEEDEEEMGAEEDAAARRERLQALRAAKELLSTPDGAASAPSAEQQQNGKETTEEQVDQPALPGPVDAPEDGLKENVSPTMESEELEDNGEMPLKFRNYLPHDERLRGGKVAPLSLPKFEDPIAADAAEPKQLENPFGNIAPKNPNWDLKRDVQKRIDKLDKRTQKALAEIALEQQKEKEALEEGSDAAQE